MSALLSHVDGPDLDRAALRGGNLCGQPARLVNRVAVEDEEAAECLLDLGVRAVRDELLAVADTDGGRRAGRLELGASDDLRLLREVHVPLVDRLALVVAQALPAVLVCVDQREEFHASSFLTGGQ